MKRVSLKATPASRMMRPGIAALVSLLVVLANPTGAIEGKTRCLTTEVKGSAKGSGFKSPCGSLREVTRKMGACLEPTFDTYVGRTPLGKDDNDLIQFCDTHYKTEKCVRALAKDCLQGVHKTAVGMVVSAAKRFRVSICSSAESRARMVEPFKCIHETGDRMLLVMTNHTAITQALRDLKLPPEERLMEMCCLLDTIDRDIKAKFDPVCPKDVPLMLDLVHALIEDARNTLCVRPKCDCIVGDLFRKPYEPPQLLLEPVMEIIFAI